MKRSGRELCQEESSVLSNSSGGCCEYHRDPVRKGWGVLGKVSLREEG